MSEYETDMLVWSEHQADLLRRMGAGERVNDQVDWANIAEEIESLGRSERRACESHLVLALLRDLQPEAWPLSREVPHWRAEARGHRADARRAFTPAMRQYLDFAALYREAVERLPETIDGPPPLPVPEVCPVTLDKLLSNGIAGSARRF